MQVDADPAWDVVRTEADANTNVYVGARTHLDAMASPYFVKSAKPAQAGLLQTGFPLLCRIPAHDRCNL